MVKLRGVARKYLNETNLLAHSRTIYDTWSGTIFITMSLYKRDYNIIQRIWNSTNFPLKNPFDF